MNDRDTALLAGLVGDIVDGILLGIPSTVVFSKVRQQAQIDSAKLLTLIEQINDRINELQNAKMREDEIKADLRSMMYSANPMGALYQELSRQLEATNDTSTDRKLAEANSQLVKAQSQLDYAKDAQAGGFSWHLNKEGRPTDILSGEY